MKRIKSSVKILWRKKKVINSKYNQGYEIFYINKFINCIKKWLDDIMKCLKTICLKA